MTEIQLRWATTLAPLAALIGWALLTPWTLTPSGIRH
jgi:hypothetical protein